MNGKRAKIIRLTCRMLYDNKEYMAKFPEWFTQRHLYKLMKRQYTRGY